MFLPDALVWSFDVFVRMSLVLAIALLAAGFAKRNAARRHGLLVAGLAAACLLPVPMAGFRAVPALSWRFAWRASHERAPLVDVHQIAISDSAGDSEPPKGHGTHEAPAAATNSSRVEHLLPRSAPWLLRSTMLVISLGALARALGLGLSLLRLRQLTAESTLAQQDRIRALLGTTELRLPNGRPVLLLESARVSGPVAAGIVGPYIILPLGWTAKLGRDELSAVLSHELAHLVRRDHWVVLIQELLAVACWFNPLVHYFNRTLNQAREEVCDNYALQTVDRVTYCEALLRLATQATRAPRGAIAFGTREWSLEARVRGILDADRSTGAGLSGVARSGTCIAALALGCVIAAPSFGARSGNHRDPLLSRSAGLGRAPDGAMLAHRTWQRSFSIKPGGALRLENLAGRVELVSGTGRSIEVTATLRIGDLPSDEAQALIDKVDWAQAADEDSPWGLSLPDRYARVRYPVAEEVKSREQSTTYLGRSVGIVDRHMQGVPSWEADLRIAIPAGATLELYNAVGPVEGGDLAAKLRLTTLAGCIQVRNVLAPLVASSDAGDIMVHGSHANLELRTRTGQIDLSRTEAGHVVVSSQQGGCRILQPPNSFRVLNFGPQPIAAFGVEFTRGDEDINARRAEILSRGSAGPEFEVHLAAGECTIEATH